MIHPVASLAALAAAAVVAAIAVLVPACASVQAPPGGERDREPPLLVGVSPTPMSVLTDPDQPVIFRFDERISERNVERAVLVSPQAGEIRVRKRRAHIEVTQEGGWTPGTIYRVVLLGGEQTGIRDLHGNIRRESAELIFSTGPAIPENTVAGLVRDRITGRPVARAVAQAIELPDTVRHFVLSDSAGFFAFRHLPPGSYEIRAFLDQSRNLRLDPSEPRAVLQRQVAESDTILLDLAILEPDTTPARLLRVEVADSLTLSVVFDDHLDPEESLDAVRVDVRELPDSVPVGVREVLHPHELARRRAEAAEAIAAAADTVPGAEDVPDPAADVPALPVDTPRADEPVVPGGRAPGAPEAAAQDTALGPLPSRELRIRLDRVLVTGVEYAVTVQGVPNIAGLPGGGGTAEVTAPEPRRPPAAPQDTAAPDTLPPPDTVPPPARDTVAPPPDTVAPPPPRDTVAPSPRQAIARPPAAGPGASRASPAMLALSEPRPSRPSRATPFTSAPRPWIRDAPFHR